MGKESQDKILEAIKQGNPFVFQVTVSLRIQGVKEKIMEAVSSGIIGQERERYLIPKLLNATDEERAQALFGELCDYVAAFSRHEKTHGMEVVAFDDFSEHQKAVDDITSHGEKGG